MLLAIQIEKKYSKDQILTFYLNKTFFGGSVYGVEAASRYYFGKSVREIDLAEAALLAGIVPSANRIYSIFKYPANCIRRRNYVLQQMGAMGLITADQYKAAVREKLPEKPHDINKEPLADYFSEEIRKYLEAKHGENLLYKGGLRVYSTLNRNMQEWAERSLREGLRTLDKRRGWRSRTKLFNLRENKLNLKTYVVPSWENGKIKPEEIVEGIVTEVGDKRVTARIGGYSGELGAEEIRENSENRRYRPVQDPENRPGEKTTDPRSRAGAGSRRGHFGGGKQNRRNQGHGRRIFLRKKQV